MEKKFISVVGHRCLIVVKGLRWAVCNSKKLIFHKEQEARGLLSNLPGLKVPTLRDIPIVSTFKSIKRIQ